jgi:hypothetical protein
MKIILAVLVLSFVAAAAFAPALLAHPAIDIVDLIWKYTGGKDVFERARFVEFTFAWEKQGEIKGSRHHTWDRYSGDYVVEATDPENGDALKIYLNVESLDGVALRNGEKLEGEQAKELLEGAYRMFINDTYWLLVQTKLSDYGVRLVFDGHEGGGEERDQLVVLHVYFENVGLTPGDQYWLYVTHDGQIVKWRYTLESGREGEYEWTDEKDCGMGIRLATRKVTADGERAVVFPKVRFSESMDKAVFEYAGK